eukprot:CAMPEP_0119415638 /NCGR_PEP_ID=MMETSP1335-20130426/10027_1 /TAXON_ID=259385 /ORGANISM="Chrysoculter rhomboideus, Strain RCC1486" /LENGTH=48 /DNA_ID= /DNA_START= /DNA_END= /DNA_ORIENTATION=
MSESSKFAALREGRGQPTTAAAALAIRAASRRPMAPLVPRGSGCQGKS